MLKNRLFWFGVIALLLIAGFWLDLHDLISLENFKARQSDVSNWVEQNPLLAAAGYFFIYVVVTAANIPGAAVMTLAGGALFGVLFGTLIVSFASTIGATLAFLLSRYLLRDFVEGKFANFIKRINNGIDKSGAYYLFTLRLVPAFPFFVINMVMGLTRIRPGTFYWVSQLGMLPGTIVYVNAGTQISRIDSVSGILSPALLGSFILLGIFPLLMRKLLGWLEARKLRKPFPKPATFDTNMVVIGAGSAGLVTAYIAAAAKARVTLIERENMGGDCLNTGCVPSKALIRSSRIMQYINRAAEFGLSAAPVSANFPALMQRVQHVIKAIEPHDSVERYTELGVDCISGSAAITSPWTVEVNGKTITTRSIVIASGGKPAVPPIPGLEKIRYLTSDNLWELEALPEKLLVMGGGAIGCELAQAFQRLGAKVTVVEMLPELMANEDPAIGRCLAGAFTKDGIQVLSNTRLLRFETENGSHRAVCESTTKVTAQDKSEDQPHAQASEEATTIITLEFDQLLVATGRRGNTDGLGLENLGITINRNGTIPVNEYLQTIYPNVYACGDVAGPFQLTHAAAHQAWYCAMNALYGRFWKFRVDYTVMPRAVFCDPEVASVGLNEQQANEQGIAYELTTYGIDDLDRAIADGEAHGFVRVLTPPGSDKILGVAIAGSHAGDIISEYVLAMRNGLGLSKILGTVHIYPTLAEANKFAAGNWRKAHLSPRLLALSGWLHRRGIS